MKRFRTLSGTIPTPAAGAGFVYQFSPIQRVKVRSVMFTFTADATVANRFIWAQVLDPNNVPVFETGSAVAIAASGVSDFVLSPRFGTPAPMQGKVNAAVGLALPDMWFPPGWQLQVGGVAEDSGDKFAAITYAADFAEDVWDQDERMVQLAALLSTLS
jgi:hypothetical protein